MLTIQDLKDKNLLLFECITGSKAYGLDLPSSDTDIKGVYVLPEDLFYGLDYVGQINDAKNDQVYYELRRFVELLYKNNPNLLELLYSTEPFVLYKHPLFDLLKPSLFLSKLCKDTFAGYAQQQIKKAKGLNKKIMNPMQKERKVVLDFCYVQYEQGTVELKKWLTKNNYKQENCGLVNIPHIKDVYGLYYEKENTNYKGIVREKTVDTILLSSVLRGAKQEAILYYNKDGYKKYCKDYKAYWDWVSLRNNARYDNTITHGKNYDAKNMMHTFRLLDMAIEILGEGIINVKRPNREELLEIRKGIFLYDDLIVKAEKKIVLIKELYKTTQLQIKPDKAKVEAVLVQIRKSFYS